MRSNEVTHFLYFIKLPHLTVGNMVQGGDNTFHTDLTEHGQRDFIVWAEPSPSFFHHNGYDL
jgi:hypothetical protein